MIILCLVGTTINIALNAGKQIKVTIYVLLRRIVYYVHLFPKIKKRKLAVKHSKGKKSVKDNSLDKAKIDHSILDHIPTYIMEGDNWPQRVPIMIKSPQIQLQVPPPQLVLREGWPQSRSFCP